MSRRIRGPRVRLARTCGLALGVAPDAEAAGVVLWRAAEGWCVERGLSVQRRRLDRRFMAGGACYSVEQQGEAWEVRPVA